MRYLIAFLCLAIAVIGVGMGVNASSETEFFPVSAIGLGGAQAFFFQTFGGGDVEIAGSVLLFGFPILGLVLNYLLSRPFAAAPGFFGSISGFFFGFILLFIGAFVLSFGWAVYIGVNTPENSTLLFVIFQIPYALAYDFLGAATTGIILLVLGGVGILAALLVAAGDGEDDDEDWDEED